MPSDGGIITPHIYEAVTLSPSLGPKEPGVPAYTDGNPDYQTGKPSVPKQGFFPENLLTTATYLGHTSRAETLKPSCLVLCARVWTTWAGMRAQNWEQLSPLGDLLNLKLYPSTPTTNQFTNITNPTQVLQGNGSRFSAPRGDRASAISSATDDQGGDNGDRNTHNNTRPHNNAAIPAKNQIINPLTRHKAKQKNQNTKNTRANMTIASLNMRGRYSDNGTTDKWRDINQLMRESKINILTLQEVHLRQEDVDSLHNLFGTRLKILFSQGANHRAAGVAIVINKDRSMHEHVEEYEMIPGRALLVQIPWQGDLLLTVLNIYAPNNHTENETFFKELKLKFETKMYLLLDIMMGDFCKLHSPTHPDGLLIDS